MLGLIKKDLLLSIGNAKSLIIVFILYIVLALYGSLDISIIPSILGVMLVISTFSYDYQSKWDSYAAILPNGRKNVPLAKYISTFILMFILAIITLMLLVIINYLKNNTLEVTSILTILLTSLVSFVFEAIMYPIIFKYGVEKARIAIFIITFAFIFGIGFLVDSPIFKNFDTILNFISNYYYIVLPLIGILILSISYIISLRIYKKKEF